MTDQPPAAPHGRPAPRVTARHGRHRPLAADRSAAAPASPFAGLLGGLDRFIGRGLARVTGTTVAPYQAAVIRIGFSLTWLLFLLREWPHRQRAVRAGRPVELATWPTR